MNENFRFLASSRTDEELYERLNNRENFLPETVEASLEELQSRGETFTDDVLRVIAEDMEARRALANQFTGFDTLFNNTDKIKQVEDPDAPAFFSKRAIYIISILFSVLLGSIMLAVNVAKTPKKTSAHWVILYGVIFVGLERVVLRHLRASFGLNFIFGIIGSYPLNYFMWNSFLGNATLYRVRKIWVPLIIGLVITAIFIFLIIYGQNQQS